MNRNIKDTLEQIVKILIVFVIILIIIGGITVIKRIVGNIHSNTETLPNYEEHVPEYYK